MSVTISGTSGISIGGDPVATDADLAALVTGKVLQVGSAIKTDTSSTTSTFYSDISGLSVTLTPSSSSSKFLLSGAAGLSVSTTSGGPYALVQLARDGTPIGSSSSATPNSGMANPQSGTREFYTVSWAYVDSPNTTSPVTYTVQFRRAVASCTVYVGRNGFSGTYYAPSYLTVMEVAA